MFNRDWTVSAHQLWDNITGSLVGGTRIVSWRWSLTGAGGGGEWEGMAHIYSAPSLSSRRRAKAIMRPRERFSWERLGTEEVIY